MSCEIEFRTEDKWGDNDCTRVKDVLARKKTFVRHFFLFFQLLYLGIPDFVNSLAIVLVLCDLPLIVSSLIRPATCLLRIKE